MTNRLILTLLLVFLGACALGPRVQVEDPEVFASLPSLVRKGDRYYLRCERPNSDAPRPESVRCEVEGDHLLVFVPILVSAKRERLTHPERAMSRAYDYPLSLPSSLRHLENLDGRVFWLDPNGTQHPLAVISSAESGAIPASSRGGSR